MKVQRAIFLAVVLLLSASIVEASVENALLIEYLYFLPCPVCEPGHPPETTAIDNVLLRIKREYGAKVDLRWIDVTTPEGRESLRRYNLTDSPAVVLNGEYVVSGEDITWEKVKPIIDAYLAGFPPTISYGRSLTITVPLIAVSGLIDGVQPCAFALLLFFLSFLYNVHKARRDVLLMGSAYILSLFTTHVIGGLGLLRTVTFFGIEHLFGQLGILLVIILGLAQVANIFVPSRFTPRIPARFLPRLESLVERATLPAALALGGLVGLCAFACSGGIYVGILALVSLQTAFWQGLSYLLMYNVVFIIPLLVALLLASSLEMTSRMVGVWRAERVRLVRLVSGAFMVALGLLTWYWLGFRPFG